MKKGQIEAGELVMVIIIVMLLLIVGLVGYSFLKQAGVEDQVREVSSESTVRLAQEAASMQELACGFSSETSASCLDYYRINITNQTISNLPPDSDDYNYYRARFGQALIQVVQEYPQRKTWTIYNNTPSGRYSITPVRIPVYIYNPVEKANNFGYILAARYST